HYGDGRGVPLAAAGTANKQTAGGAGMDHARRADRSEGDVRARPIDNIRRTVVRHDDAGAQLQAVAHEHRSDLWLNGDGRGAEIGIAATRIDGYFTRHAEQQGAKGRNSPKT